MFEKWELNRREGEIARCQGGVAAPQLGGLVAELMEGADGGGVAEAGEKGRRVVDGRT